MILPSEIESGNIEYKLKIIPDNNKRLVKLSTQLKWRCGEGRGLAIYFLGVTDKGIIKGLDTDEIYSSLKNLEKIVNLNDFTIIQKNINQICTGKFWATIMITDTNSHLK